MSTLNTVRKKSEVEICLEIENNGLSHDETLNLLVSDESDYVDIHNALRAKLLAREDCGSATVKNVLTSKGIVDLPELDKVWEFGNYIPLIHLSGNFAMCTSQAKVIHLIEDYPDRVAETKFNTSVKVFEMLKSDRLDKLRIVYIEGQLTVVTEHEATTNKLEDLTLKHVGSVTKNNGHWEVEQ